MDRNLSTNMTAPRVLLADDHLILLEALKRLLEPHCHVIGVATDGRSLLEMAGSLRPDIIVADI